MEHDAPIEGVSFVESWIVENPKVDKSTNFGMEYPKGSWMATMKVDNDDVWNNYVKTGKIQGFSVDAMIDLKEVNLKSNIEMAEEQKSFKDQVNEVLVSLGIVKEKEEVTFASVQSGDITIEYEGETLEVGTPVFVVADGERVVLPDGEYPTDMGVLIVAEGTVAEIRTEVEAEKETAAPAQAAAPSTDEITNEIKSLLIKYSEEIDEKLKPINDALVEFKKENESLKSELTELSKQPASKPIKSEVNQVELTAKGRLLEKIRNNSN